LGTFKRNYMKRTLVYEPPLILVTFCDESSLLVEISNFIDPMRLMQKNWPIFSYKFLLKVLKFVILSL
jgi:hypothetical protein